MKSHITKQLLASISVDIRIYLPLKVIFTSALLIFGDPDLYFCDFQGGGPDPLSPTLDPHMDQAQS